MSKSKMRNIKTCGAVLMVIGAIFIIISIVALVLYLMLVFGLWPDWAIEAELVFREAWKAWMR